MKSYKNLYLKLCSYKNLERAFRKARKGKSSMPYVKKFESDLTNNLLQIKKDLESFTYSPLPLTKFTIRDPKTRLIKKSDFRDRIVHHTIVNVLEPIYEKIFVYDSYANRLNKGTMEAVRKFDKFKRKVSENGKLVKYAKNNNMINGYALKADIKHFFNSVNHNILIKILRRKIKDSRIIKLVNKILKNFDNEEKGMPLGNMTSQFFANVYLNDLDYFIKHKLKMKYYIRYVDDFVILHKDRNVLEKCKERINNYLLENLKLELHPDKSKVFSIYRGVGLLGFRVFYYYRLLRKRNVKQFNRRLLKFESKYKHGLIDYKQLMASIEGWFAYAMWADTYNLRKSIVRKIDLLFN